MRRSRDLETEVGWFADWASWKMCSLDDYETVAFPTDELGRLEAR
jgi:hypothetical protein